MVGFFEGMFGGGYEREAAERNRAALGQYQGQSLGALGETYQQATGYGRQAVEAYNPLMTLASKYGKAGDLYLDALGVNGPEGTARSMEAMKATPGYNAGIEAVMRGRSLGSMGASGGTDTNLADYMTRSIYSPFLQNLNAAGMQGGQYATTAAGGQAAGWGNLAGLAERYGGAQTGVYGNVAQGNIAANNQEAAGQSQGMRNLLGAGLSIGGMLAGGGGGGLFGSLASGVGGMFGGGTPTGQTVGGYGAQGQPMFGSGTYGGVRYPAV